MTFKISDEFMNNKLDEYFRIFRSIVRCHPHAIESFFMLVFDFLLGWDFYTEIIGSILTAVKCNKFSVPLRFRVRNSSPIRIVFMAC